MDALWRYGLPPSVSALCALLESRREERMWRSYMAAAAWRQDRLLGGRGFPSLEEWMKPQKVYSEQETARNRARLLAGLRGEVTP